MLFRSGLVTLGSQAGDKLTLGELITAADDAGSTGILRIQSNMDLETLTTYARGYSIEWLGGGTIASNTKFLNSGYLRLGLDRNTSTVFTSGMNAENGPSALVLAGTLASSEEVSDATLLLGNVQLYDNSFLNTYGNTLSMGSLDSIETPHDLTLESGIGNGTVLIAGNVGGNKGTPSVLEGLDLTTLGKLFINGEIGRAHV